MGGNGKAPPARTLAANLLVVLPKRYPPNFAASPRLKTMDSRATQDIFASVVRMCVCHSLQVCLFLDGWMAANSRVRKTSVSSMSSKVSQIRCCKRVENSAVSNSFGVILSDGRTEWQNFPPDSRLRLRASRDGLRRLTRRARRARLRRAELPNQHNFIPYFQNLACNHPQESHPQTPQHI
jgi:hypothetical protein